MKTAKGEGKTVENAIENALDKLKVSRELVDVEIIQKPSAGILRLKHGPAIVQVTLKKQSSPGPSKLATVSVTDGKLFINPSSSPEGVSARLRFGQELHVLYHNEVVEEGLELNDGLEPLEIVLPENIEPKLEYEVQVNETRSKAELFWKRSQGIVYQLADHPATNQLQLTLHKILVEAPILTLERVAEIAREEGLKFGLKLDQLNAEVLERPQGVVTLAEGTEPQPPKQPSVRYHFQEEEKQVDMEALRIDYYEVHGIQHVKPGDILATKDPGKPGVPGVDVYGEPIAAEALKKIEIEILEGAALSEDGLTATATVSGLPQIQKGMLKVSSVFELNGNADLSTGNITMEGAIIIRGNVLENVKLESNKGDIIVHGLVSGATLRTSGSINVLKNVIRSQLYAGGTAVAHIHLLSMLHKINLQLTNLYMAYETIVSQTDDVPFENLIKHLVELKFYSLPKDINEVVSYMKKKGDVCSEDLVQLAEDLATALCGMGPLQISDITVLQDLIAKCRIEESLLETLVALEADVKIGYLQNSQIEAARFVEITGKGCFYSSCMAGKGFKIPNGVVRGGRVIVNEGKISARELGGPTGIATSLWIVKDGQINANMVHPNVSVAIGEQSYTFDEAQSQAKAFLQSGLLVVYAGSNKIHG